MLLSLGLLWLGGCAPLVALNSVTVVSQDTGPQDPIPFQVGDPYKDNDWWVPLNLWMGDGYTFEVLRFPVPEGAHPWEFHDFIVQRADWVWAYLQKACSEGRL